MDLLHHDFKCEATSSLMFLLHFVSGIINFVQNANISIVIMLVNVPSQYI